MPPTPQQYPVSHPLHVQPAPSLQQQTSSQSNRYSHGYSMSFDANQQSMNTTVQPGYSQSFPNGPVSNTGGYARSFGEGMQPVNRYGDKPQIYTAVYSGVSVYEMEIGGVACMRRRSDGWLNATQILKVAGVDKGKRTKVLEKEVLPGEHEKVQGGYGKYQGTWISYARGREFCRQYGVEDTLRPLLEYDVKADGTGGLGQDTPTKEQALAAQRKRFYTSSQDARPNGPISNGTFFSNISPSTSVALAAMNKAARLNSPAPRPASAQRPPIAQRPSQQDGMSGSQQSLASEAEPKPDSGYATQMNGSQGEPPRKRRRADSQEGMGPPDLPLDTSMRSATPTEPNESFLYDHALMQDSVNATGDPVALPALPSASTEEQQEKINLILSLFADQDRVDYTNHPALTRLTNEDLNMPLDVTANNALHWAVTLAKIPLLRLLIQRGASIWRGNAIGQTPLISAVLVNNCWERSCFPDVLELLGPLIEVRDHQGRTILHSISVSSAIKARAASCKYYLEALLEFLVRIGKRSDTSGGAQAAATVMASMSQQTNGEQSSQDSAVPSWGQPRGPVSLPRFLSHIVNARDKAGNTALNLAARAGNRNIIHQLLEIHGDARLPNNKGICARDFGVGLQPGESPYENGVGLTSQLAADPAYNLRGMLGGATPDGTQASTGAHQPSYIEELGQEVIASMTSLLTQSLASHKELLRGKSERIDALNAQLRELSAQQAVEMEALRQARERVKLRAETEAKIANLKREVGKRRAGLAAGQKVRAAKPLSSSEEDILNLPWLAPEADPTSRPPSHVLRAILRAYRRNNDNLHIETEDLRSRSVGTEALYRRVVALCTGVPEARVEECLEGLVAAVESERERERDAALQNHHALDGVGEGGFYDSQRVREFLKRVDGGVGATASASVSLAQPLPQQHRQQQQQQMMEVDVESDDDGPMLIVNPTVTAAAARAEAARRMRGRVR